MDKELVRNVMSNKFKRMKYVIMAERKLTRDEMLKQIRRFNEDPVNIRQKPGTEVVIIAKEI